MIFALIRPLMIALPVLAGVAMIVPGTARADGFSSPHTLPFKLNSPGMAVNRETLRANLNAAARAVPPTYNVQSNSNCLNCVTNTSTITNDIAGAGVTLSIEAGKIAATQDCTDAAQAADNQALLLQRSNYATSASGVAQAGVTVSGGL